MTMTKVYYQEVQKENGRFDFEIITDESKAKELGLKLASVNDLTFAVEAAGEIVEGVIEIAEGLYQWMERVVDEFCGMLDIEQGYFPIQ